MLVNILVASTTVILLAFAVRWWFSPSLRASIEQPKFAVAEWDRSQPAVEQKRDLLNGDR